MQEMWIYLSQAPKSSRKLHVMGMLQMWERKEDLHRSSSAPGKEDDGRMTKLNSLFFRLLFEGTERSLWLSAMVFCTEGCVC